MSSVKCKAARRLRRGHLDLYIKLYSLDEYVCVDGAAKLHNIQKNYTAKSINMEYGICIRVVVVLRNARSCGALEKRRVSGYNSHGHTGLGEKNETTLTHAYKAHIVLML